MEKHLSRPAEQLLELHEKQEHRGSSKSGFLCFSQPAKTAFCLLLIPNEDNFYLWPTPLLDKEQLETKGSPSLPIMYPVKSEHTPSTVGLWTKQKYSRQTGGRMK